MDKLNLSSYISSLRSGLKEHDGQESAAVFLLSSINDQKYVAEHGYRTDNLSSKKVSLLMNQKDPVPDGIRQASMKEPVIIETIAYFRDKVMADLNPHLKDDTIDKLLRLIEFDDTVSQNKKNTLMKYHKDGDDARFLAETFLYALNRPNKKSDNSKSESPSESPSKAQMPERDIKLLGELMHDFNTILKFSGSTDLTISPMPMELPVKFDFLYEKWKYRDSDFKSQELNSLKYDILNTLYNYFSFWSCYMWYDCGAEYYVHKKPLSGDAWEIEENLRKHIVSDRTDCHILHERLCKYVIDFDIEINEDTDTEVITESNPPDASSKTQVTIIQNQTNIAHSESKTYNIKDSNITIND